MRTCLSFLGAALPTALLLSLPALGEDLALEPAVEGLGEPVEVVALGDVLFVVELRGAIRRVVDGVVAAEPVVDLSDRVPAAGHGVLSLAFHPDFEHNGLAYVLRADGETRDVLITRLERRPGTSDALDPDSEVELIRVEKSQQTRHYGGRLRFGPDGMLYAAIGDGSLGPPADQLLDPECAAQSLGSLEGKILRLDVDVPRDLAPYYEIPVDNPFVSGSGRGEIWAYGLRNPWRFSFDRESGDLWIGDVGEDAREEVDLLPAGSGGHNLGWKVMEGTLCVGHTGGCGEVPACNSPSLLPPVIEYAHGFGTARCSITGGLVYRGSLAPDLYGQYLYGDFCSGDLWAARPDGAGGWVVRELGPTLPTVVAFAEDRQGEVLLSAQGAIVRLVDRDVPSAGIVELAATESAIGEAEAELRVAVRRVGEGAGAASVRVRAHGISATAGVDFASDTLTLAWRSGETGVQFFPIALLDDDRAEPTERIAVELDQPTGGVRIGARARLEVDVIDDDPPRCVADTTTLCLHDGRFRVEVHWRTHSGASGRGRAVPGGATSGSFWFFRSDNPELFVKVLDACFPPFEHFWVFAAGLTDVETRLVVTETETGRQREYFRPLGVAFEAVQDTAAFAVCR